MCPYSPCHLSLEISITQLPSTQNRSSHLVLVYGKAELFYGKSVLVKHELVLVYGEAVLIYGK